MNIRNSNKCRPNYPLIIGCGVIILVALFCFAIDLYIMIIWGEKPVEEVPNWLIPFLLQ